MNHIRQLAWSLAAGLAMSTAALAQLSVDKCEWWLDSDFDGRTQVAITNTWQQDIDASALSTGVHTFGVRVGDSNGLWGQPVIRHFLVQHLVTPVNNQLSTYDYWIDNQYADRQTAPVPASGTVALDLDMSSLTVGVHQLAIRVNDTQGLTSQLVTRQFAVQRVTPPVNNQLTTYEYWIDNKYADRQTNSVPASGVIAMDLDMSSLSDGAHALSIRVNDSQGLTSQLVTRQFLVHKFAPPVENALTTYDYWFDGYYDSRHTASVPTDGTVALDLDVSALTPGLHTLSIRVNDSQGLTSQLVTRSFLVVNTDEVADNTVATFRYWIDNNYDEQTIVSAATGTVAVDVDASALTPGLHRLYYQLQDAQGLYGPVTVTSFTVPDIKDTPAQTKEPKIAAYEYWFDDQPRHRVDVEPTATLVLTGQDIPVEGVVAKTVTPDYTFKADTKQVWVRQDVVFGLQVFSDGNAPTPAKIDTVKSCGVKVDPTWTTLTNEQTDVMGNAPTGGEIRGYEFSCQPRDSVFWIVDGAELTYDFYDGEGRRLDVVLTTVGEKKAYALRSTTDKVYALAYGAAPSTDPQQSEVKVVVPAIITIHDAERIYGDANPEFTYESNVELLGLPELLTVANELSVVGEYPITINTERINNTLVIVTPGTMTINKAPLTISGGTYAMHEGAELPEFVPAYSGFKNSDAAADLTAQPTLTTTVTSESAPGTYEVTVEGGAAQNYEITRVNGKLVVGNYTYTLSYTVDGQPYKTTVVRAGTPLTAEAAPTKEGYTFSGWDAVPAVMPAENVTVNGSFIVRRFKATFMVGEDVFNEQSLDFGTRIVAPEPPVKEGYTFISWGDVAATMPAEDVSYTAQYRINQHQIIYFVDDEQYRTAVLAYGTAITPEKEPVKEGYTFSGWKELPKTMPDGDVIVAGTFTINQYMLTFMADDEVISEQLLDYGTAIHVPNPPQKTGHTFITWGDVADTMPAGDVTYTAQYEVNQYRLIYLIDGEEYKTVMVDYDSEIIPEDDPEDDDYFYAWEDMPERMPDHDVMVNAYVTGIAIGGRIVNGDSASADGKYEIYSLDGKRLADLQKGVNIIRYPNGKTKKVIVK
ncbi:MAG: InlB B-repeat-containing protein [Bacteroidaceae bacterium]|nr:InlB B-repeat-containing protein [Bacteroidaceae bacterium]